MEFKGDKIVCTVSVGVLKASLIEFVPAFPKWKQNAIEQAHMGIFCKIFLSFPVHFWGSNPHYFFIASEVKGRYAFWKPLPQGSDDSKHFLMCVAIGDEGRRIEALDAETVKDEVEAVLKRTFQDKLSKWKVDIDESKVDADKVFRPLDVHVCKWDKDPRYCGAYSAALVGSFENEDDWDDFVSPLPAAESEESADSDGSGEEGGKPEPTLFFAGEAYSERYGGYMQGAYQTGHDTACEIIEMLVADEDDENEHDPKEGSHGDGTAKRNGKSAKIDDENRCEANDDGNGAVGKPGKNCSLGADGSKSAKGKKK